MFPNMEFNYLTQHYDNHRSGWNPYETQLTVNSVRQSFGHLFTQAVDGQVYAQPLYVQDLEIPGNGTHNVVFVATEGDSVYAFDADALMPALAHRKLVPTGETPILSTDVGSPNIWPQVGITSTPVIDRTTNTLYAVAKTKTTDGKHFHQRLYALDLATLADKHSPVEIQAAISGTAAGPHDAQGNLLFDAQKHLNRPGLLLQNGVLHLAFSSHGDNTPYHGWVLAYNADTLQQVGVFNASPEHEAGITPADFQGNGSGIWQAGIGLAADSHNHVYCTTGNGPFNANTGGRNYGDTVLKLQPNLIVVDFFTQYNQQNLLPSDTDLGSGGVMLLPDQPGQYPHLLVACGKEGIIYLINRDHMGGYNGPHGPDRVAQSLPLQPGKTGQSGTWGGPAYYQNQTNQYIYYCGNGGQLTAFTLTNGVLTRATSSADHYQGEGGTSPTVSSDGGTTGTAIVWAIERTNPLHLRAYDATNLQVKLFPDMNAGPWNFAPHDPGYPFVVPTVANGKVYVGSDGQLNVFGLQ